MKILMMLLMLAPAMVQAELIQNNDRDIYDLMWLPRKGLFYGSSEVIFEDRNFDITDNGNSAKRNEADRTFYQTIGHSFTDRLALNFTMDYLFRGKDTLTPDVGNETVTEAKGFGDPAVSLRWRALDQERQRFNLDLIPRYRHSSNKFKLGTGTEEGNNYSGRSSYGLRVEAGKKYTKLQWMTYLAYSNFGKATGEDSLESSSYTSYEAGLKILGPIETGFFLYGALNLARASGSTLSDDTGTVIKSPERTQGTFEGGLTYLPYPDLSLTGAFQLGKISNYKLEDDVGGKINYKNGSITALSLLARYQF